MSDNKFLPLGVDADGVIEEVAFTDDGKMITRRTFNSENHANAILEKNKEFNNSFDGYSKTRELQHVASIPMLVIEMWIAKYGVDPTARGNEVLLARLLNDPEWREIRTGGGRVAFKERGGG